MIEKLGGGMCYQESHFNENVEVQDKKIGDFTSRIEKWNDYDQHQLCHKAMK